MLEQARDAVRFKANLDLIKQCDMGCAERLLLQAGRQHAFGPETELPQGHIAIVQCKACHPDIDGIGIKVRLVGHGYIYAKGACGRLSCPRYRVKAGQVFRPSGFQSCFGRARRAGQR